MEITFQQVIEELLRAHKLLEKFQSSDNFHVHFDMEPYQPLVIERHSTMISVAHYFKQGGDLIADPDVELHYPSWVPTAIQQAYFGYRSKFVVRNGVEMVDKNFHREVSSFLNIWADNIKNQGWAERATIKKDE